MSTKDWLRLITIILFIIFFSNIFPVSFAELQNESSQELKLYYRDSTELSTEQPISSEGQTFSFGPSLMVSSKNVGRWSHGPLNKPIKISCNIVSSMLALGSGSIYFENRLFVNN